MTDAFADVEDEQKATSVDLSENVAEDVVRFARGNIVGPEEEFTLMYFGALSGWGYSADFHINTIGQGPPGSGKSLTKNTMKIVSATVIKMIKNTPEAQTKTDSFLDSKYPCT